MKGHEESKAAVARLSTSPWPRHCPQPSGSARALEEAIALEVGVDDGEDLTLLAHGKLLHLLQPAKDPPT